MKEFALNEINDTLFEKRELLPVQKNEVFKILYEDGSIAYYICVKRKKTKKRLVFKYQRVTGLD